jgi:hypothetical protein
MCSNEIMFNVKIEILSCDSSKGDSDSITLMEVSIVL